MAQTFNITIEGYWRDVKKRSLPIHTGIFFVYECLYNSQLDTVTLIRIIYIGGATKSINDRVNEHQLFTVWKKVVREGNEICYSSARIEPQLITQIKAAFIFFLKPPLNDEFKNSFSFTKTTILCSGKTGLVNPNFTVGTE